LELKYGVAGLGFTWEHWSALSGGTSGTTTGPRTRRNDSRDLGFGVKGNGFEIYGLGLEFRV